MFLKDLDDILTVKLVEVVLKDTYIGSQAGAYWKRDLSITDAVRKTDYVDLEEMLILSDCHPVPLNSRLGTMKALVVVCQGYIHNIQPEVWTWNNYPKVLPVHCSLPCTAPSKYLFGHPQYDGY